MNALFRYLEKISLPNVAILNGGQISNQFLSLNINNLYSAIHYVHQLPYRRISNKPIYTLVLKEKRGTCSPKHALIAALAQELNVHLVLRAGILIMTPKNMPAISDVLNQYSLKGIPEAHVYLEYNDHKLDITFPDQNIFKSYNFSKQIIISPDQIGDFKDQWHQQAIIEWLQTEKLNYQLDDIWKIRELCINAIS